jgi:hypothetical protein
VNSDPIEPEASAPDAPAKSVAQSFQLVWSPDGKEPPKKRYSSFGHAEADTKKLARLFPGQEFFVMTSACSYRLIDGVLVRAKYNRKRAPEESQKKQAAHQLIVLALLQLDRSKLSEEKCDVLTDTLSRYTTPVNVTASVTLEPAVEAEAVPA